MSTSALFSQVPAMSRRHLPPGTLVPTVVLGLAALLLTGGAAGAAGDFTDVQLESRALEELRKDAQLEPLNLIVVVKDGVATLRGLAPSKEVIQRATQRVRL